MTEFESLDLHPSIKKSIKKVLNFKYLTPVQEATIPLFIQNKDVCVEAITGSGKTLGFLIPIIHKILVNLDNQQNALNYALIVSPTRELSSQIYQVTESLIKKIKGYQILVSKYVGGEKLKAEVQKIESEQFHILIATPGRLFELINHSDTVRKKLKQVEMLILDEADRLLSLGFEKEVTEIFNSLPRQRRTGLFSATMSKNVEQLIEQAQLRNTSFISVKQKGFAIPDQLENNVWKFEHSAQKLPCLLDLIQKYKNKKMIVFFCTCASTNFYLSIIKKFMHKVYNDEERLIFRVNGQMKQTKRDRIFQTFSQSQNGIMLTTDLLARGIDIPDIDLIIQFDAPQNPDFFIHRIGRTARAGAKGRAIVFLLKSEWKFIEFMELKQVCFSKKLNNKYKKYEQTDVFDKIKEWMAKDRELMEQAQKAFVACVRAYKEQYLNYIFQFKNLDLGQLANSFALFRLPRIKEILGKTISSFTQSDIDIDQIPYKDSSKEKIRQSQFEETQKQKLQMKEEQQKNKQIQMQNKKRPRNRKHLKENDWEEFSMEERLVKKLKKGLINVEQFQEKMGIKNKGNVRKWI